MLIIERMNDSHDRASFRCGNVSLDNFIHNLASQFERKNLGRTYILVEQGEGKIKGYFTIAGGAIPFENVPPARKKKVSPHLPVPVILLGKLAVDLTEQGKGYGSTLIGEVSRMAVNISQRVGIHAILASAIDDAASAFYKHQGFIPLIDQNNHLYLPIDTIIAGTKGI